MGLTRPAKDGDDSGGADSGGNPGTCEKKDQDSKATVRDNELYKEGNAGAETKQKELKRVKRAKRNAIERDRKKEKAGTSQSRVPRETLKKAFITDQGDESEKNAGHGASNRTGGGVAQQDAK